jgi:quercetin dioxygenase-like cupin family protein
MASTLPPGELFALDALVTLTAKGIASRVLARTAAGNITLFAFDAGEELSERAAPFDALVLTLSGALVLTIGGRDVQTTPQSAVLMYSARSRSDREHQDTFGCVRVEPVAALAGTV